MAQRKDGEEEVSDELIFSLLRLLTPEERKILRAKVIWRLYRRA